MSFYSEEVTKALKNSNSHPENKNIHCFYSKDFAEYDLWLNNKGKQISRGAKRLHALIQNIKPGKYHKILLMDNPYPDNANKKESSHAEGYLLMMDKNSKIQIISFTQTEQHWKDKSIMSVGKNFNIIGNKLAKTPFSSQGCLEYAILNLQNFNGFVLKLDNKTKKLSSTHIMNIKDGDNFIAEEQLKLYQSSSLLKQFNIKSTKNPEGTNVVYVTDSKGRKVTLDEYTEKYMLKVETPIKKTTFVYNKDTLAYDEIKETTGYTISFQNKKLNMHTALARDEKSGSYNPPRPQSTENIKQFRNIDNNDPNKKELFRYGDPNKIGSKKSSNGGDEYAISQLSSKQKYTNSSNTDKLPCIQNPVNIEGARTKTLLQKRESKNSTDTLPHIKTHIKTLLQKRKSNNTSNTPYL